MDENKFHRLLLTISEDVTHVVNKNPECSQSPSLQTIKAVVLWALGTQSPYRTPRDNVWTTSILVVYRRRHVMSVALRGKIYLQCVEEFKEFAIVYLHGGRTGRLGTMEVRPTV